MYYSILVVLYKSSLWFTVCWSCVLQRGLGICRFLNPGSRDLNSVAFWGVWSEIPIFPGTFYDCDADCLKPILGGVLVWT